jgi:tetratricopeptide (TPR) repeat protein
MAIIPEFLAQAAAACRSGQLGAAEQAYQQVLQLDPNHAEALAQLGQLARVTGRFALAVEYLRRAVAVRPGFAVAHAGLGQALAAQGQAPEAEAAYREAIRLRPRMAEAHAGLGHALLLLNRSAEAETAYREAVRWQPAVADAYAGLGNAYLFQGQLPRAEAAYREAVRRRPDFAEAHLNLGSTLSRQGRTAEAEAAYREATRCRPDFAEAHNSLGGTLHEQGRPAEAEAAFREALRCRPDFAEAHNNLGNALYAQGRWAEAEAAFREALRRRPDHADAHTNLGILLIFQGRFAEGWAEYEWRWRSAGRTQRTFHRPAWDGSPLAGRTILLYTEQGLGDTLHFIRYATVLKRQGATVVLECPAGLWPLLRTCPGVDAWANPDQPPPRFDVHAALLSLPHLCRTTLTNVPAEVPYLTADPALVDQWRERLSGLTGFRIGIAWQGNPRHPEKQRFMPLRSFAALAAVPGMRLVSLQKGTGREQLAADGAPPVFDLGPDADTTAGTFMDTAAVMRNLDLVLSADTAVVHLAGALGVPAWVALPALPNFRWMLEREDSPWYPSLRLFRQPRPGDWATVFGRMAALLESRL